MKKYLLKLLLLSCIGILALSLFACVPSTEQYKLEFIVDGEVYDTLTTNGSSKIDPPTDPSKLGYSFAGWYFDLEYSEEFHNYSLQKDPIKKDTKIYAKWDKASSHTCVAGDWIETPATCKTAGKREKLCIVDYCKTVMQSETILASDNHINTTVTKDDIIPATCVAEGSYTEVTYCHDCERTVNTATQKIEIDINAHVYANCALTKAENNFDFTAVCSLCANELVLKNVSVDTEILNYETCSAVGKIRYTYLSENDAKLHAVLEVEIPALGHKISDVTIENNPDAPYDELTHNFIVSKVNIYGTDSNNAAKCGEAVNGIFICETCGEWAETWVKKPHVGNWELVTASNCYNKGQENLEYCESCEEILVKRDIAPTGDHRFGNKLGLKQVDERFDLVRPCLTDGCPESELILVDVPAKSKEIISDNCEVDDVIQYSYKYNGTTAYLDVPIESGIGHFIGDIRAVTLMRADGVFDYQSVEALGAINFFGDMVIVCDQELTCYYECSSCGAVIGAKTYRAHSGNWIITVESTCTVPGKKVFYCDYADCTENDEEEIPVIPHTYEWELKMDSGASTFSLIGKCTCDGCDEEEVIPNVPVITSVSKNPTCYSEGEILYTYNYEGKDYKTTENTKKINHSLAGVITDVNQKFDYAEYVLTGKISIEEGENVYCGSSYPAQGYFDCSVCSEKISVNVYRNHIETVTFEKFDVYTPCVKSGYREIGCVYSDCGVLIRKESFDESNHKYIATLDDSDPNVYNLTIACTVEGCDYKPVSYSVNRDNMTVTLIKAPTCKDFGTFKYEFVWENEPLEIIADVEKGNHTYLCVDFETLLDGDGYFHVTEEFKYREDFKIISNSKIAFVCEVCGQLIPWDKVKFDIPMSLLNSDDE